ncbi:hypothetical protein [Corynebacterium diphtheriae]|uniref:hypothetical protein n=1 Tax=Corynebacterium diphtheriae TaxID=1717 RepID=UPI0013C984B4|nr:hypothetical protein [Corynebacterium diphtheriae]CAB0761926.1 transposase [Corynebacterium diphtheriae]CAB0873219.1 transposase [Corynebacterium diphtheriae]
MSTLTDTLAGMKDTGVAEIAQLGRTMNKRRKDTPRLPRPLHLVVPDPRRQHPTHNQRTLKPEEPFLYLELLETPGIK